MKKRIIALLMCFVLSFSLVAETLTYSAAADDADTGSDTTAVDPDTSGKGETDGETDDTAGGESTDTTVTLTLNLNGGTGIHSIRAAAGTSVTVPNPTREGYTFLGWSDVTKIVFTSTEAVTVTATTYTAAWQEPTESSPVAVKVQTKAAGSEESTLTSEQTFYAAAGAAITQDTLKKALICDKAEHTHTAACAGSCTHSHSVTCFGFAADAAAVTLDASTQDKVNALGTGYGEGWYIYQIGETYYLRQGDSYYKYESAPSDNVSGSFVAGADSVYDAKCTVRNTHVAECYNCGKEAHAHSDECYQNVLPDGTVTMSPESLTVSADSTANVITLTVNPAAEADSKAEPDTETEVKSYTVTVKYVYAKDPDGEAAEQPKTFTVNADVSFNETVYFPTVVGYESRISVDGALVNAGSYTFAIDSVSEDVTLTVYYVASTVNYTVCHYLQSPDSETVYNLYKTETKSGRTGETVGDAALDLNGYTAQSYGSPVILGNGTTRIDIKYDLNSYKIEFDLDDGTGVENIEKKYGAKIKVGTPTKDGCTFAYWGLVTGEDSVTLDVEIPETMPAADLKYKAYWIKNGEAKVTLKIWGEKADTEGYELLRTQEIIGSTSEPLSYQDLIFQNVCKKEEHTHDSCKLSNCPHTTHAASEYGLNDANKYDVGETLSGEVLHQFTLLDDGTDGVQNGYIYHYRSTEYGDVDRWYLYTGNTWYRFGSSGFFGWNYEKPDSSLMGERVYRRDLPVFKCEEYYERYEAIPVSCPHTEHEDSCYTCGKSLHVHTSDCYTGIVDMDASKWWLHSVQCGDMTVDEEGKNTVTVQSDGTTVINLYYNRNVFTLNFRTFEITDTDVKYTVVKSITAKWGASIIGYFPIQVDGTDAYWTIPYSTVPELTTNSRVISIQTMPAQSMNFTMSNRKGTGDQARIVYYTETLGGMEGSIIHDGKNYDVYLTETIPWSLDKVLTYKEDFFDIEGFTQGDSDPQVTNDGKSTVLKTTAVGDNELYYTRNTPALTFCKQDGTELKACSPQFGEYIQKYDDFTPEAPEGYKFVGWYTSSDYTAGTEFKIAGDTTMPATDLKLYAKYEGITCGVYAFLTEQDTYAGQSNILKGMTWQVKYGEAIGTEPGTPTNGSLEFRGWYYRDKNGIEHTFNFGSTPVKDDLFVYAKWTSDEKVDYTIYYMLEDGTQIASPTTGAASAGVKITAEPKTGNELYEDYREHYFPTQKSAAIEALSASDENSIIFVYKCCESVTYTVHYYALKDETKDEWWNVFNGEPVYPDVVKTTGKDGTNCVTYVDAKPITGYIADVARKEIILLADAKNEISFYYTKDEKDQNCFTIWHRRQNTDGTWSVFSVENNVGNVGSEITVTPVETVGFTVEKPYANNNADGKIVVGKTWYAPTVVKVDYKRNQYPYKISYTLQDGTEIADTEIGKAYYESTLTAVARDIEGYTLVGSVVQSKTITIEEGEEATLNVINFTYKKNEGETPTYTVRVHYTVKDTDTAPAGVSDFMKEVESTNSFNEKVIFPKVTGYHAAMYDSTNQWIDKESYEFNIAHVTEDITVNVRYYPDLVEYKVNHYLQNLDGSYECKFTSTKKGHTDERVGDVSAVFEGYYAKTYDHPIIKADGTTEVNIYYDRRSYTVTLDLNGGTGIPTTVTALSGQTISVGTPTRAGYDFAGWWLVEGNSATPAKILDAMPAANVTYRASWTPSSGKAEVTVRYYVETDTESEYAYYDSEVILADPNTTIGKEDLKSVIGCGKTEHGHTKSCLNCKHQHTPQCFGLTEANLDTTTQGLNTCFNDLGLENGYIYCWEFDYSPALLVFKTVKLYYLYLDGKFYKYPEGMDMSSYIYSEVAREDNAGKLGSDEYDNFFIKLRSRANDCNHGHSNDCFTCGQELHIHDETCSVDLTTRLADRYVFNAAKYTAATVNADGSTELKLYFDRSVYCLTFIGASDKVLTTIAAKWGTNIADRFQKDPIKGMTWKCTSPAYTLEFGDQPVQTVDKMPDFDATFTRWTDAEREAVTKVNYYVADIGTETDSTSYPTDSTGFRLYKTVETKAACLSYETGYHDIPGYIRYGARTAGFEQGESSTSYKYTFAENETVLNLYYMRDDLKLTFCSDESTVIQTQLVPYDAPLNNFNFTPNAPSDADVFEGWYTTPQFIDGTKVDLTTMNMPESDLELYARFVKKDRTVKVYLTEGDSFAGKNPLEIWSGIKDGTVINDKFLTITPKFVGYEFDAWKYRDANGVEQAFNSTAPITQDYTVYGTWTTEKKTSANYTVKYVVNDGEKETVISSLKEEAAVGKELRFKAESGEKLGKAYRYYSPDAEVKFLIVSANEKNNNVTFVYTQQTAGTLTIAASAENADKNQYFLFTVTGNGVNMTVSVPANGSTSVSGLWIDKTYTVTPQTWSWRYATPEAQQITLKTETTEAVFTETKIYTKWLSGETHK